MKIRKGDKVFVQTGKDRGKTGTVARVMSKEGKIIIDGINLVKKTVKGDKKNPQGGLIEKPVPINASNVQIICGSCGKSARVGFKVLKDGKKERICKKCSKEVKE